MAGAGNLPPEIWTKWEKQGKVLFLNAVKKCTKPEDAEELARYIYDFLCQGILGNLKKENLSSVLGEILAIHESFPAVVLDTIYAVDAETSDDDEEQRQNLYEIIKELEKCLPEALLKERLEIETLLNVGTLKNNNFRTKFIRIKTKLYYKQKKFNLLREESEGYSKLITELNQEESSAFTSAHILEATKALIGCFNLDPNRVVDLILEALEIRPNCADIFIEVLNNFSDASNAICEILGFKFVHFHRSKGETPRSLHVLAALLLQRKMIALDDIYSWLMPLDSTIEKEWETEMKKHTDAVKKLNSLSTNKEKDEVEPELAPSLERFSHNQKFGLCEALLSNGVWLMAKTIIGRLPPRCALSQPPISRALCRLIHSSIEPLYALYGGLPSKVVRTPPPPVNSPFAPAPVQTFLDLRKEVIPMLLILGNGLHVDPLLIYKIIRISRAAIREMPGGEAKEPPAEDSLYFDIISLLDIVILPSLSHLDCNCSIAEEIWTLIKHFPYYHRYCLYSRWKNSAINDDPKLLHKNAEALKSLKSLMKRVSKENVKPIGRMLGKLTHACPGVLFDYVLIQLQVFENMILPVVDSLKFLTSLSYDVLGFCIVETMVKNSADKGRHKLDGTSISNWLQALASFCGAAFKKYNIELTGLLQFVANQLKDQNSLDLLILREVVLKMAGIEAAEDLTNEQVSALCGGELLKGEAGYFSQVRNTKKSSMRLKEALSEMDLGPALCLLMAQQRYCVVYRDAETTHLKHVGKLYDQCQDTLVQFGTFLCSSLSVDEYVSKFPSVHAMLAEYHISGDVAFFLARPTLNHAINMKYEALRKADPNAKKMTQTAKHSKYCEAVTSVLTPLMDSVRPLHPSKIWDEISPLFLVTFWSLSMYDLHVPVESYNLEIAKLKKQTTKEAAATRGKKEVERFTALIEKLQEERKKQTEHVEKVMARLKIEKTSWFPPKPLNNMKSESVMNFLQLCIFPRCLFSAVDAVFCAKFISTMHSLHTEYFPTVLCLDRLFCDITYTVTMCTENEANRYGRFLCAMLDIVRRWHGNVKLFNEECLNTPGFVAKFRFSSKGDGGQHITYEPYRDVCHKWYYKITRAMMLCLESKDFNQIRNAIIVLIKILPHFPLMARLGGILIKCIDKIRDEERENRKDLYTLATSYFGQLKAKSSLLIREDEFHQVQPKEPKEPKETKEKETKEVVKEVVVLDDDKKEKREKEKSDRRSDAKSKAPDSSAISGREREKERNEKDKEKEKSKEAHRERARERKEEKHLAKEERVYVKEERAYSVKEERSSYREDRYPEKDERDRYVEKEDRYIDKEDRYLSSSGREDSRYGSKDDGGRYSGGGGYYADTGHYYEENRDLSSVSNSSPRSLDNLDQDRDIKRRKVEGSSSKGHRSPEWVEPISSAIDKADKKERGSRSKDKTPRREKKSTRKRDRHPDDGSPPVDSPPKHRKDDDMGSKSQNGNSEIGESSHRSKRVYASRESRDKTPIYEPRERERSHDKPSIRDKQRAETSKRR